jgi:hypothetical protein
MLMIGPIPLGLRADLCGLDPPVNFWLNLDISVSVKTLFRPPVGIPLPFPFLFYNFEPNYCPQPGYEKGYSKDYYYYRPSSTGPWADPRACRAIVIPGV